MIEYPPPRPPLSMLSEKKNTPGERLHAQRYNIDIKGGGGGQRSVVDGL